MKIVHVTPLLRASQKESLSYFTLKNVHPGSFVLVPVRNKHVYGLVTQTEDVTSSKINIKDASYGMKKVISVYDEMLFLPEFLKASEHCARYFAATTGAVLETFTPQSILTSYLTKLKKSSDTEAKKKEKTKEVSALGFEKFLFQSDEEDRMASYRSLIREHFAKNRSVFICLPTIEDVERVAPLLNKGISEYTLVLHSNVRKKDLEKRWEKACTQKHPLLIVATGSFLSVPRRDLGVIVVDKENAGGYKTLKRPYIDIRTCAEFLAKELKIKLILGDILLRTETLYEREQEDLIDFSPLKFRSVSQASQTLLDMKSYTNKEGDPEFFLLAPELKEALEQATQNNESFFLLTARRGLYPITLCNDCGDTVRCRKCDSPLVLHGNRKTRPRDSQEKNVFMCHSCSEVIRSRDICQNCGSWRFATLGIGSERVEKEVKRLLPNAKVLRFDKDSASTKTQAQKIIKSFESKGSAILIGTEMALPYLGSEVANSAVVSVDSLFTIPDFRIYERVFALLLRLRFKTRKNFFIQTRLREKTLFNNLCEGNLMDFYRNELEMRKQFSYPPFSLFIKLVRSGRKDLVEYDMAKLKTFLKNYNPIIFPALSRQKGGSYTENAVIRIPKDTWPDDTLRKRLMQLPPSFSIRVDPENIL